LSIIDSARNRYYLNALGLDPLRCRDAALANSATLATQNSEFETDSATSTHAARRVDDGQTTTSEALTQNAEIATPSAARADVRERMQKLAAKAAICQQCDLCHGRKQAVFGVGNPLADWMIIGEAPGAEEDRLGQPFVGRAGKLLDKMLLAIDLDRERAYIANVIKCRPDNNRDPRAEEIQQCLPFLQQQIALMRPKMILIVGRIAAQTLLQSQEAIGRLRGKVYRYQALDIPMVVTYHPAYLLRSPSEKQKSWQDLLLARAHYLSS